LPLFRARQSFSRTRHDRLQSEKDRRTMILDFSFVNYLDRFQPETV
jgi:hypothetical protein